MNNKRKGMVKVRASDVKKHQQGAPWEPKACPGCGRELPFLGVYETAGFDFCGRSCAERFKKLNKV